MIEHKIMVSFLASKVLTADEMCDIEGAIAAQVEEPMVHNEDGDYVDDGAERGRGGQPPVRAIEQWIRLKRISVPKQFKNVKQFAFVIARSIGKKGKRFRKAYPFIIPALNYAIEKKLQFQQCPRPKNENSCSNRR